MKPSVIPAEIIENKIYLIRGHKVMLSPHLAELYSVQTKILVQAVKRNLRRFPQDCVPYVSVDLGRSAIFKVTNCDLKEK